MSKRKPFKLLFTLLFSSSLILGCGSKENQKAREEKAVIQFNLKNEEWSSFIDSSITIFHRENSSVDSISLYYMMPNTPSVICSPKYVVWKKNGLVEKGEFNFRESISDKRFFFGSFRKRGIGITEIDLRGNKFKKTEKKIVDLNSDEKLSDPCNQITNVICHKSSDELEIVAEIYDSCFDKYFAHKAFYSLTNKHK